LWTRAMIDKAREPAKWPKMTRIVVAVDPSGARGADDTGADMIGIVVCGRGDDGRGWVLGDRSLKASPAVWGRAAVDAYQEFNADRIVAERNFGGAMVEAVIRAADQNVAYSEVTASRGKVVRAEPIAALYEQGRVSHTGDLSLLEDQLCEMASDGFMGDGSPDRVDALVWALTELMTGSVLTSINMSRDTVEAFAKGMVEIGRRERAGTLRGFGRGGSISYNSWDN
jgi:phage terminase large subunit-like protein